MRANAETLRIYCGLRTQHGVAISAQAVDDFALRACPKGATVTYGTGVWNGEREPCAIIEIVQPIDAHEVEGGRAQARWIMEHYTSQFDQALGMFTVTECYQEYSTPQVQLVRL